MAKKDDDQVPGLVLEPALEAKLDNLDDNLNPINEDLVEDGEKKTGKESEEDAPKDKEKEQEPKKDDTEQSEESDKDKGDESESTEEEEPDTKDKGSEDDEKGYAIDEGEEEDKEEPTTSTEKGEEDTRQLTAEQKYILDNLQPITVRGTVGSETEVKEYKVYSPEYLPQGFKYVDDRELSAATKAFSSLEQRATQLQGDYRNQETQKATKEFKEREDAADRQDIASLQREGQLPLFKADPNSADFEKDPGVVLVQEIIDYKEAQNDKYLKEYNAGRPYKHIGFEEAFRMFQRDNPTKSSPEQTKEDKERVDQAKRTSKTSGQSSKDEAPKARVHSGMTGMDLDNLIESKTAGW